MADPTGVNFNDTVYAYTADMFSTFPPTGTGGTGSFSLNSGETAGQIGLTSPNTPLLIDGASSTLTGSGTITSNAGTTVSFSGERLEATTSWDFTAPDGRTYWVAEIQDPASGEKFYVSNYTFEEGETYTSIGRDNTPNVSGDTYDSAYGTGFTNVSAAVNGLRVDDIATPDAPSESPNGLRSYAAYSFNDVNINGSTLTFASGATAGTFESYDNDNYFSDGLSYQTSQTDVNQFGSASVGDSNDFTNILFQAEHARLVRNTSTGEEFILIMIESQAGDRVFVSTAPIDPTATYTIITNDGSPGYDNPTLIDSRELAPQYGKLVPACFTSGTLISTAEGARAIDDLAAGDLVMTMDNGLQPIRWIGSTKRDAVDLATNPKLRPVRIPAGALGKGLPERDLIVSRQHRVLVRSKIAQRIFCAEEILVPAIKLVGMNGIEIAKDAQDVTYFHILFDKHEVVFSEGAPTESLFTGPAALQSVSAAAREEIETLFPEITDPGYVAELVRLIPNGSQIKQLIARHQKNLQPLVAHGSSGSGPSGH